LLKRKAASSGKLALCLVAYEAFTAMAEAIDVINEHAVAKLTQSFNTYRDAVIYTFEGGQNVPQENLRSTMMEEFFGWLFKDIFSVLGHERPSNYLAGKATSSYLTLTFAPKDFLSLFDNPNPRISRKDQDFAIGATMKLSVGPSAGIGSTFAEIITLPVVAIECKTYLAKNHLDMCSSTAQMLKRANPYCMYIIAAEFLKMDKGVTPEVTDIAEIFLLCKADNASRAKRKTAGQPPHPVCEDVVQYLFDMVVRHLRAIWWDPDSALERGKVISRPF
jgi:hypothetical protein